MILPLLQLALLCYIGLKKQDVDRGWSLHLRAKRWFGGKEEYVQQLRNCYHGAASECQLEMRGSSTEKEAYLTQTQRTVFQL